MLEKCRRGQWSANDLDWELPPRDLSVAEEEELVSYFTNMAAIERLASALFREQRHRTRDPVLREVFASFVADEMRHSEVAARLARRSDRRRLRRYRPHPALERFEPCFVDAVR